MTTPSFHHNSEHLTHPKYRADIDGLRAIAVLSVVGFHAFPSRIQGGFIGVDIFFVISGFLISIIIFGSLEKNTFSYKEFYERRIRRIFPALIVVFIASVFLGWIVLLADEYELFGKHMLAGTAFISNFILWSESGYFDAAADTKPLLHLWSLGVEEQFYIFWPLLLGFVWKRKWNFLVITAIVAVISFAINVAIINDNATAAFYSPASRFWELMIGGLLAYIVLHKPSVISKHRNVQSAIGFLLLALGLFFINEDSVFPGWWALLPTFGAFFIISAGATAWINKKILSNKLLVWFGLISYPLYLWHWPLLSFARIANNYEPTKFARFAIVLLAIFLSWLTLKLIEKPIRVKGLFPTRYLVVGFIFTGMIAGIIVFNNGFPNRAINHDDKKLFINSYSKFKKTGLFEYFQEKCDFYNWETTKNKKIISKSCTESNNNQVVFLLWGDSHAQALSYGFRKNISPEIKLAQIATSGCNPKIHPDPTNGANKDSCIDSNNFAIEFIKRKKPSKVFVAQRADHELTDWKEISQFVKSNGGELILIGPMPQWRPSLPIIVAKDLSSRKEYVKEGLDMAILQTNEKLGIKYKNNSLHYISIIDHMCNANGCKALIDSQEKFNLMVMDYGHLTPAGSDFVVKSLLLDQLDKKL